MFVMRQPFVELAVKAVVYAAPDCVTVKFFATPPEEMLINPLPQVGPLDDMLIMVEPGPAPERVIALFKDTAVPPAPQVNVPAGIETVSPVDALAMAEETSV